MMDPSDTLHWNSWLRPTPAIWRLKRRLEAKILRHLRLRQTSLDDLSEELEPQPSPRAEPMDPFSDNPRSPSPSGSPAPAETPCPNPTK